MEKKEFNLPYDFPIRIYETDLDKKPSGYNGWHWHDEMQLCLVKEGTVQTYVGDRVYEMKEGEGLFVNSGCLHMSRPKDGGPAVYYCMNVDPVLIYGFKGSLIEKKYFADAEPEAVGLSSEVSWQGEILMRFERIRKLLECGGSELEITGLLCLIWSSLVHNEGSVAGNLRKSHSSVHIKKIIEYIQERYMEKIRLEDIAEAVYLDKSTCCRVFKEALGCTIWEYLAEYRIRRSIELLTGTNESIAHIGYACGFTGASYYSQVFRKMMGCTPNEYRRKEKGI